MQKPSDSPAVQSLRSERAQSHVDCDDDITGGLEDTFPASDPVSATHTAAANVISDQTTRSESFPLVEEALDATGADASELDQSKVHSLRRDAVRIADQASEVASGAASLAKSEASSILHDFKEKIRQRPLTAVGIVAAIAWVWGATR
jgi:ElaB/YqjD/DUF883 family membrane-anchored ribosome-binding protein